MLIQDMLQHCVNGNVEEAYKTMAHLWKLGYSAEDIITNVFRVCKNQNIPEFLKLEFIKVTATNAKLKLIRRTTITLTIYAVTIR
jgi:DNA polymerase III gamma/tau subunit